MQFSHKYMHKELSNQNERKATRKQLQKHGHKSKLIHSILFFTMTFRAQPSFSMTRIVEKNPNKRLMP